MGQDQQKLPDASAGPREAAAEPAAAAIPLKRPPSLSPAPPPSPMPPPLPSALHEAVRTEAPPPPPAAASPAAGQPPEPEAGAPTEPPPRRIARRRPAGPVRNRIAANDDAPSIGGLIYALEQKPSGKPFTYAAIASGAWGVIGVAFAAIIVGAELGEGARFLDVLARPTTFLTLAAIVVPIAVLWFLALLAWRAEELRLRSSTMTEVAVRLAEPDRMAEQSVASLGQAVRQQVSFMNDAVSRALGRAGELEALVHNEVAALERSYEENERKIRGLIQELSGERHALLNTSERVSDNLRTLGNEVPTLIEKLSTQQIKLAQVIQGAGENLTSLESSLGNRTDRLQLVLDDYTGALGATIGTRTEELRGLLDERRGEMQAVLEGYTTALDSALGSRTEQMQLAFEGSMRTLDTSISNRTENLQTVFEEYARALDSTLANRAAALDVQLVERTRSLDQAFEQRLANFDEQILRSTMAIDSAVGEKARALTNALESHAKTFGETIGRQAADLDEQLMHGINSVRRSSENITRQSLKAIEGLAGQSDMLRNVTENLLNQINTVTNRFDTQTQSIMRAANSLETANYKIDSTLQTRQAELSSTLDRLSGKADEVGRVLQGYSSTLEGTLSEAEVRARQVAEELQVGTERRQRAALADLERLRATADEEGDKALEDLRRRFSTVSNEVTQQLGTLTSRFDETSQEMRQHAARAAAEIAAEQRRIAEQFERLPATTRENADAMRRALQDQLKALEQLSDITSRGAAQRDVATPSPPAAGSPGAGYGREARPPEALGARALSSLSSTLAQELDARMRSEPPAVPTFAAALPSPTTAAPAELREAWSLGDLLARASREEDPGAGRPAAADPYLAARAAQPFSLNVEVIARALDASTASALWSRLRAGQRGIMVRSIYSAEGRVAFDEVSRRYRTDAELYNTVNRYLADFERILREAEQKDPSGRLALNHLVSNTGRVYLFLGHASGRLG
jgi:hypothetical protein